MAELNTEQQHVLRENLPGIMESGLASRYHAAQVKHAKRLARLAGIPSDPAAETFKKFADETNAGDVAEAPFLFMQRPSNMARELLMVKVNPETGETIPGSDVQIGLIGGLAGNGSPVDLFSQEDVILAKEAMAAQKVAGF